MGNPREQASPIPKAAFALILTLLKRPDDRREALVALRPQSRSEAETEGADRRHDCKRMHVEQQQEGLVESEIVGQSIY